MLSFGQQALAPGATLCRRSAASRRVLLTSLSFRDLLRTQILSTHNRTLFSRNEYYNARPEDFSARRRDMVRLVVSAAVAAIASTILGTVTDGTGLTRSIAAGRITRTVTSSRQIQFGLKYV